jgi:CMP/dCMP kinase
VTSKPFVIALDGPAASGKSTVGMGAAKRLGLRYFDTGLLYRVLTWLALELGVDVSDAEALTSLVADLHLDVDELGQVWRDGANVTPRLHSRTVDASVSTVSAHHAVRAALIPVQRSLVVPPGMVMAGRDIGTVIVPDAPVKIWLSAGPEERARRRAQQTGEDFAPVLEGMLRRDRLDSSRAVAPMARAPDALEIDTNHATPEQVIERIVELARARGALPARRISGGA